jgi:preprotein translocase subunit SecE
VKTGSALDVVLWIVALALLIAASLVNQYLPGYWVPASNIWVRVGVIVACIVVAFGLLYATHQGKGFVRLLGDSRMELRRVTWPTKQETVTTSWQVLLVVIIAALALWGFDHLINWCMKFIIG